MKGKKNHEEYSEHIRVKTPDFLKIQKMTKEGAYNPKK